LDDRWFVSVFSVKAKAPKRRGAIQPRKNNSIKAERTIAEAKGLSAPGWKPIAKLLKAPTIATASHDAPIANKKYAFILGCPCFVAAQ
jgi:hypothetical protein